MNVLKPGWAYLTGTVATLEMNGIMPGRTYLTGIGLGASHENLFHPASDRLELVPRFQRRGVLCLWRSGGRGRSGLFRGAGPGRWPGGARERFPGGRSVGGRGASAALARKSSRRWEA